MTLEDMPENFQIAKHLQRKNSIMVCTAVSENGKLPLKYINKKVKIRCEVL